MKRISMPAMLVALGLSTRPARRLRRTSRTGRPPGQPCLRPPKGSRAGDGGSGRSGHTSRWRATQQRVPVRRRLVPHLHEMQGHGVRRERDCRRRRRRPAARARRSPGEFRQQSFLGAAGGFSGSQAAGRNRRRAFTLVEGFGQRSGERAFSAKFFGAWLDDGAFFVNETTLTVRGRDGPAGRAGDRIRRQCHGRGERRSAGARTGYVCDLEGHDDRGGT